MKDMQVSLRCTFGAVSSGKIAESGSLYDGPCVPSDVYPCRADMHDLELLFVACSRDSFVILIVLFVCRELEIVGLRVTRC